MNNDHPIIEVKDLTKLYNAGKPNEVTALSGISLRISKGDFIAITGPSGSGKSTLMHILGLLDVPTTGTVYINGVNMATVARNKMHSIRGKEIGFVFQGFNLLPILTALENVAEAALYVGTSKKEATAKALNLLEQVGLKDRIDNFAHELSGGQQQRVAIARALVNQPSIILADEPTGELDSKNAQAIMDLLEEVNTVRNQTVILVTHSETVAARCKTIVTMVDGQIESIHEQRKRS